MPLFKHFLVADFDAPRQMVNSVIVPKGAIFRKLKALPVPDTDAHIGIFAYYEVPTLISSDEGFTEEKFAILGQDSPIPDFGEFIDIIDVLTTTPEGNQGVVVLPVYRIKI